MKRVVSRAFFIKAALLVDVLWAGLLATILAQSIIAATGSGVAHAALLVGLPLIWLLVFLLALFCGLAFMVGAVVLVCLALFVYHGQLHREKA